MQPLEIDYTSVNRAFTAQAVHYDTDDSANPVLQGWRQRVYNHVYRFLRPLGKILELNSGTGIDAVYFAKNGHTVLATDLSDGMIGQMRKKAAGTGLPLDVLQLSFDNLHSLSGRKFDFVFSNFGGLNCIDDLSRVTRNLPSILEPGAFVTWVIMPKVCPWEWSWILKGNWKDAFRRLRRNGAQAHLEGEYFTTYYHSLASIRKAFGSSFVFLRSEGLGVVTPPPGSTAFVSRYPALHSLLLRTERMLSGTFPFNRWGDHIMVTFQYQP